METFLEEIKNAIDVTCAKQMEARNRFVNKLRALGYWPGVYHGHKFAHPSEEGKIIVIDIQSCYGNEGNQDGFFDVEVRWEEPHEHDEFCDRDCPEFDNFSRLATPEEVVAVLANDLKARLAYETEELERDIQLERSLPSEEEIAKIRRKVEEELRSNRKTILPVAKLLKVI